MFIYSIVIYVIYTYPLLQKEILGRIPIKLVLEFKF